MPRRPDAHDARPTRWSRREFVAAWLGAVVSACGASEPDDATPTSSTTTSGGAAGYEAAAASEAFTDGTLFGDGTGFANT